ncbi:hypothetical protein F1514_007820 [Yersinia pestis]|uniref:Uncharacterized protein n=3 Tax=Yersinia pestis TaxID=632 RepID=Q8CKC5_YERPE|nr:hypothetical [Yersinia pestis KIM10+]ABG16011.1 conserved hypothetical protein [Yersinia pestis Antiqua]ABG16662.1 conserved hypothetical protein [Yersinia pestis Nepal516]ABP41533.1 conserved hypothetical protein [Yersinia pestis Pestoides F]ADW00550.1 hypothetical protein YPC_4131 [Yersinia pestis biovar Medievalis str. Harbin 35]EEO82787.1 hypothetical protein YPF_0760 [Yersinia pestis biovar Orientalis str. India 195]EEO86756.1 hypothetical protein YPH_2678 [Yersinia pestis biovar Orie
MLGGKFGSHCYIAVNKVRICAAFVTFGAVGSNTLTKLAMLLTLMESASRTRLRTLVM